MTGIANVVKKVRQRFYKSFIKKENKVIFITNILIEKLSIARIKKNFNRMNLYSIAFEH